MGIRLSEHKSCKISKSIEGDSFEGFLDLKTKSYNESSDCYTIGSFGKTDPFIPQLN